jgi:hypothetical protein
LGISGEDGSNQPAVRASRLLNHTVHEPSYTSVYRFERFRADRIAVPEHIQEIEDERRAFRAWLRLQRMKLRLRQAVDYWPLALGLLLGPLAPHLRMVLMQRHPWSMWVVFPFVLLAGRPELNMGGHLASALPSFILYAQFPVEGLIVQWALRRRVTVHGVAGRLIYLHYLGAVQLLMISGVVGQALMR